MSIKPIDYHLSFNNTVYESKEKQNDFNRLKETNAFLQNHQKNEIHRNKTRIQSSQATDRKKIDKDNRELSQKKENKRKHNKSLLNSNDEDNIVEKIEEKKGQKLDIFI